MILSDKIRQKLKAEGIIILELGDDNLFLFEPRYRRAVVLCETTKETLFISSTSAYNFIDIDDTIIRIALHNYLSISMESWATIYETIAKNLGVTLVGTTGLPRSLDCKTVWSTKLSAIEVLAIMHYKALPAVTKEGQWKVVDIDTGESRSPIS